jgi:chemotaxis receptor (MCP) glutamine deamidase CheD
MLFCSKTVDDIVFEVDCKMVVVEEGQVDIGKSIGVSGLGTCVELMLFDNR